MLLTVILLSGAILGITSFAGLLMLYSLRQSVDITASHQAIYAADSGIECSVYKKIKGDSSKNCGESKPDGSQSQEVKLTNGAVYNTIVASDDKSVKSIGRAGRSIRAFEISF